MKNLIFTIAIFMAALTTSIGQTHEGNFSLLHSTDGEAIIRFGGNDKDVVSIGGFRYGIQYEFNMAGEERSKFSVYGGFQWNTFLTDLKVVSEVNLGIVWNGEGAAGVRFGGLGGLEYQIGKTRFLAGLKYDEFENRTAFAFGLTLVF